MDRNDHIEALYLAGETLQAIGDRYSLTRERVRQILVKRGVPSIRLADRRPPKPVPPKLPKWWKYDTAERRARVAQVCSLYRSGARTVDIIELVEGVNNPQAIYRCLRYGGVTERREIHRPRRKKMEPTAQTARSADISAAG